MRVTSTISFGDNGHVFKGRIKGVSGIHWMKFNIYGNIAAIYHKTSHPFGVSTKEKCQLIIYTSRCKRNTELTENELV